MIRAGQPLRVSVVIPTWRREAVLVDTVRLVLEQLDEGDELLVVDQTAVHEPSTARALEDWEGQGKLRLLRREKPSIPAAMNAGLRSARAEVALFLDDDVLPAPGLIAAHRRRHEAGQAAVVAGRVIQPWDKATAGGGRSRFAGDRPGWVGEFMGGNFSVRRAAALGLGGFDEKFVRAAYRFEKEFADRVLDAGGRILFAPEARLEHLRAGGGGTRAWGEPWSSPGHAVGEYYYLLRSRRVRGRWRGIAARPFRAVRTRLHLLRPWLIPVTLAAEAAALLWALALRLGPPRLAGAPAAGGAGDAP